MICRNAVDEIYNKNYTFKPGMPREIIKSKSNILISSGPLIHNCLNYKIIKKGNWCRFSKY